MAVDRKHEREIDLALRRCRCGDLRRAAGTKLILRATQRQRLRRMCYRVRRCRRREGGHGRGFCVSTRSQQHDVRAHTRRQKWLLSRKSPACRSAARESTAPSPFPHISENCMFHFRATYSGNVSEARNMSGRTSRRTIEIAPDHSARRRPSALGTLARSREWSSARSARVVQLNHGRAARERTRITSPSQ